MRNLFSFMTIAAFFMAAAFCSCTGSNTTEPEKDNVPSIATIDSLWEATDLFPYDAQFKQVDMSCYLTIDKVPNTKYVRLTIRNRNFNIYYPDEEGYSELYFTLESKEKTAENMQGFYRTYPNTNTHNDRIVTGKIPTQSSLFYRLESPDRSGRPEEAMHYVESGKLAVVKKDNTQYHLRFQVSILRGDSVCNFEFDRLIGLGR